MNNFNLTKFFREQYLAEGQWQDLSNKDLGEYDDDIIGLIQTAYDSIGGHPNYKDVNDVSKEANKGANYKIIDLDNDGDIDATMVSKPKPSGEKFVAAGHDGSSQAKRAVITHKIEKLKQPGFYIEVSGRIKDILVAAGIPQVTDEATIEKALEGKKIIVNKDGSYKRKIGGTWHEKIMLGSPMVA